MLGNLFIFLNLPWEAKHTAKVEVQPRPSDVFKELGLYDDFHYSPRPIIFLKRLF